ncbi:RNA ligase/cyclic nucleotide phosphodiesterase [Trichoderma compactum]
MNTLHASLRSHPVLSKLVHLLPKPSWHMTVVDGVRDTECEPGMWPPGMEKLPLDECTREFSTRLRAVSLELEKEGLAPPYKMRVRGFDPAVIGIGFEIEGANPEEEKRLRRLRDGVSDALGFRAPNHETYGFHITMAYLMRHIDGENRHALNQVCLRSICRRCGESLTLGRWSFARLRTCMPFTGCFISGSKTK